jgi:hypothetical protein
MPRSASLLTPTRTRALPLALAAALALGALGAVPTTAHAEDSVAIRSGSITWGVKSSFRNYVTSQIANGTITTTAPATDDGTRTTFPSTSGNWASTTASVGANGAVRFSGHNGELDVTIANPEIRIATGTASLVADVTDSDDVAHDDLTLADLDLTGAVTSDDGVVTITNAPATITAAGSAVFSYHGNAFYPAGTALDPVSASFTVKQVAPTLTISKTTFTTKQNATVTVTGKDFYPEDSLATRPPLAAKASGVYVVVGRFAEAWQPSASAPSSARKALGSQTKWAVLAADMATIGGPGAGAIELSADGGFTAELSFSKDQLDAIAGLTSDHVNYGIYTYPGGGATKASWEKYVPVTFTEPTPTSLSLAAPTVTVGSTAKVTATISPSAATGTVTLAGAGEPITVALSGGKVEFTVPAGLAAGTHLLSASYAGSDLHAASAAETTLTVAKAGSGVAVSAPASSYGTAAKVTVSVSSAATGKVTLSGSGIATQNATLSAGRASFTLPATLAPGSRTLTAAYSGDATFQPATATATLVIAKTKPVAKISVSKKPTSKKAGKAKITVSGPSGATKPTGKATLKLTKGKKSKTVTVKLSAGATALTVPKLAKGTWKVQVKYAGDSRYAALGYTAVGKVTVTK